jgi:hypothetical protein
VGHTQDKAQEVTVVGRGPNKTDNIECSLSLF